MLGATPTNPPRPKRCPRAKSAGMHYHRHDGPGGSRVSLCGAPYARSDNLDTVGSARTKKINCDMIGGASGGA